MHTERYNESDLTSPAAAHRGALWLDSVKPDWTSRITRPVELDTFDRCICGQVFREDARQHPYLHEGYLYAKEVYGEAWDALLPWNLRYPNTRHNWPGGLYLGFKGDIVVSIAWAQEIAQRKRTEIRHLIGGS